MKRFPGHVACDPAAKSELVIPCFDSQKQIRAVLDVDSNQRYAFDHIDQENLELLANHICTLWR